jgi:hypothetical protein
VSGEPEPWEAELLFTEQAQHAMRELYSDEPEKLPEIDEVFAGKTLVEGRLVPLVDGPGLVARVARWYGLPEAP